MHVYRPAKRGLRQHALHLGTGPVRAPILEEFFLTRAKQLQPRQIDFIRVILRVIDVVGAWSHFWNLARRAALEFSIL